MATAGRSGPRRQVHLRRRNAAGTLGTSIVLVATSLLAFTTPPAAGATPAPIVWKPAPFTYSKQLSQIPFTSVSCPATTFCMAGRFWEPSSVSAAQSYDGTSWGAVKNLGAGAFVSCPTTTFCVSVDPSGDATTWNGTSWSKAVQADPHPLSDVSCATASFCMAVDTSGKAVEWSGSTWTAPPVANTNALVTISCPSTTFCVAGGGTTTGFVIQWNGTSWSAASQVDSTDGIVSISCTSSTFCIAFDEGGGVMQWNGTTWTAPLPIDGLPSGTGFSGSRVSCVSSTFCMAMSDYTLNSTATESYWTWNGTTWRSAHLIPYVGSFFGTPDLSCSTSTKCVLLAVNYPANVVTTWNGTSWSVPRVLGEMNGTGGSFGSGNMFGGGIYVSCPTATFCASSDGTGVVAFENSGAWSPGYLVANVNPDAIVGLSCASSSFCVAIDSGGGVEMYQSGWKHRQQISTATSGPAPALQVVSCVSTTFCAAFAADGTESRWNGTAWSAPALVDDIGTPISLSCPTGTFCRMVDTGGYESTWNGTTWSNPSHFVTGTTDPPNSISCPSTTSCVVITKNQGHLFKWSSSSGWSAPITGPGAGPSAGGSSGIDAGGVTCVTATFCALYEESYAVGHVSAAWNGTSVVQTPNPTGDGFWGVSCYALDRCVGVTGLDNDFSVDLAQPPVVITTASVPNGVVGTAYSTALAAKGGTSPYTFTITAGSPPPGLTLSTAGAISGTPTTPGTSNFTVKATDSSASPLSGTKAYSLTITS